MLAVLSLAAMLAASLVPQTPARGVVVAGGGGGGTLTHVQAQGTKWFGGSGTTEAPSAITATGGNLLVIAVGWGASGVTISSVAGNGNTYTLIDASADAEGNISTYYAKNCAGGSTTVTVTFSADPGFGFITVHEVSGASTTAPLDKNGVTVGTPSAGVVTSGSVTTTTAGQYIFGATFDGGGGATFTAGTGYTIPTNANQSTIGASEYQIQGSAGSIAATFNETGSNFGIYRTAIATFK